MMEDFNEKLIQRIKVCTIIVIGVIVGLCVLFFIGIAKVDAANAIGGYNGANDTEGIWWSDTNYDYRCGWSNSSSLFCGTFDRALAILYNYQPSTSDTLTFSASIYTQADYMSSKVWNNQVYVLWGYGSNLYYNWTLQDSCTIDGSQTTEHINNLTDRKLFYVTINCTASPPVSGAYPVIYNLQRFSDDTWGGLSNYNFNLAYVTGTITQNTNSTDIINNQNQNAQQQIENANKNKDEIIANQNENADKITDSIENQNTVCENTIYTYKENIGKNNYYLDSNSDSVSNNSYFISNYTQIKSGETYTIRSGGNAPSYCLYDNNKTKISCSTYSNRNVITVTPTQNGYIRYTLLKVDTSNFSGNVCYNRIDQTNDNLNDINDSLNDNSVDNPSSSFNGLENNFTENSVISDLLLLPVTLYQSVLNSINGTCSPFNLGTLYGHNLTMPCLNISGVLGNAIYGVIDVLISGFFILGIRKKFVDIFENFTSLKVGGNELE